MKRRLVILTLTLLSVAAATLLWPNNKQSRGYINTVATECPQAEPLAALFEQFSPNTQAQGEEGANSVCDDYSVVCEDVAYRTMTSCDYWGLGDCFCKGQRAYNKCMNDVGCPGISALAMARQGCSCLNKSCLP